MIEPALVEKIRTLAAIIAIPGLPDRIYPVKAPQDSPFPCVVYERVSGARVHSHQGASGLASPRIEVRSWGKTYADAKSVSEAIRAGIDGFSGNVTVRGVVYDVNSILLADERDLYDEELKVFGVSVDYTIWHAEA